MQCIHSLGNSHPISHAEPAPPHIEEPEISSIVKEDAVKMKYEKQIE
jgi:hypothetical protein